MSITRLNPGPDRFHHRHDSTELDVFEAARYFSVDAREEIRRGRDYWTRGGLAGGRRMSLDIPTTRTHYHHYAAAPDQKQPPIKDKKHKQPSSPGGRLASFLNSLFSQSAKKKSKSAAAPDHDLDDSPGGARRKRRSSISHFSFGSTNAEHNRNRISDKYASPSVFAVPSRYPAPASYDHGPTKNDLRSLSDHRQALRCNGRETRNPDLSWLDREKFIFRDALSEKHNKFTNTSRYSSWDGKFSGDRDRNQVLKDDYEEGAESDSSSDLFELENYDLGDYSSSLPVYDTTRMDSIRRGAPIPANGP